MLNWEFFDLYLINDNHNFFKIKSYIIQILQMNKKCTCLMLNCTKLCPLLEELQWQGNNQKLVFSKNKILFFQFKLDHNAKNIKKALLLYTNTKLSLNSFNDWWKFVEMLKWKEWFFPTLSDTFQLIESNLFFRLCFTKLKYHL